jgi:hypothetical protein
MDSSPCVRRAAVAFDARREQQPWGEHRCPTVRSRRWSLASRRSVTALRGGMRTTEPFVWARPATFHVKHHRSMFHSHRGRTMDTRPIRLIDSELDAVFAAARPPKRVLWCEPSQCSHPVLDRTNFPGPRCVPPQDARVRPFR